MNKKSTKPNKTNKRELWVAVILDESGSMGGNTDQTISGFNEFLQDRQKEASKFPTRMWVTTFSTSNKLLEEGSDPRDIKPLNRSKYDPSGGTALYDAIGSTVQSLESKLNKEFCECGKKTNKPDVLILIMTDGEENSSVEFRYENIKSLIVRKERSKSWVFKYIGANVDAMANAQAIGASGRGYTTTNSNFGKAIKGMSKVVSATRIQVDNNPDFTYSASCWNIEADLPTSTTADQLDDLTVNSDGTLT